MPASKNLGQCHFDANVAVKLLPENVRTQDEADIGSTEWRPVCQSCFDRFAAQHLGGSR